MYTSETSSAPAELETDLIPESGILGISRFLLGVLPHHPEWSHSRHWTLIVLVGNVGNLVIFLV